MFLFSTGTELLFSTMTFRMGFCKEVIYKVVNLPGNELSCCRFGTSSLFPFAKCFENYQPQDKPFEEFSPFRNAGGGQPQ